MDLSVLGLDPIAAILLTGFAIGAVELVKALFDRDWRSAGIIAGAAVAGVVASFPLGIGWLVGLVGGLASSGVVTLAQNIGK